jgi:hypothetical protein
MTTIHQTRTEANAEAVSLLCDADPVVIDVAPAIDVIPGYRKNLVLTSGAPLPWSQYDGGQRDAIIGGALFEGLASTREDAIAALDAGDIEVGACHDYGAVGSLAGIYTASMPVFVVRNRTHDNVAYCNFYEGKDPRRLNYGCYDQGVHERLLHVNNVYAPVIGEAIRRTGGIALKPLIAKGLRMGDECHSRNSASSLLFSRELFGAALDMSAADAERVRETFLHIAENDYFFLRLSMAASKATADAIVGLAGSSVVSAMVFSCKEFAIRVSGLGEAWFRGPTPIHEGKLFAGHDESEIAWMGGESPITETVGLGGFAQACALSLQDYQGGSPEVMIARNQQMYQITAGENTDYKIPLFGFRGTPTGVDIFKVLEQDVLPVMDVGLAGRDGGQIGAGVIRAPRECFEKAAAAYRAAFPDQGDTR